jgi:uncharacterized LabA/DUF88 family protein
MPKTAIYIDGQHFLHGTRGQGISIDLDLAGLLKSILPDADIVKSVYFNTLSPREIYPDRNDHEALIFERFEAQGIQSRYGRTEVKAHIFIDRGIDVGIATEMTIDAMQDLYDVAVIVSRRPELAVPVKAAQDLGKKVTVLFYEYESDPTNALKAAADTYIRLDTSAVLQFRKSGSSPAFPY